MKKQKLALILTSGMLVGLMGGLSYSNKKIIKNEVLLTKPVNNINSEKGYITTAFIGIPQQENGFAVNPNFDPNGFASPLNKKLYEYESSPSNQNVAMNEAIKLHNYNPINTCVFFQASCLRAIGESVPNSIGYTLNLERWLEKNNWSKETDFNYIQKGDIVFAGQYHTFLFMGWKDKSKGIAYVMGDESYMYGTSYKDRNLRGQQANANDGWNNQYKATCYFKYNGTYEGITRKAPQYKSIGRVSVTSPVGLWLNNKPSFKSKQIELIGHNIILNVIKEQNGWYEVYYNGHYGWVDGQYTTGLGNQIDGRNDNIENENIPSNVSSAIGTTTITALEGLDVDYSPSMESSPITAIPYNSTVYVFKTTNDGWAKVYYNGYYGWIYLEYTDGINHIKKKVSEPVKTSNNPVKATSTSTNKVTGNTTKVKTGMKPNKKDSIKPIRKQVNKAGYIGKIRVESIIGIYLDSNINTYDGINTIPNNTILDVIKQKDGWYKVEYNGQKGWVNGQFTSELNNIKNVYTGVNEVGQVIVNNMGLYNNANKSSRVLTNIPIYSVLNILGEQGSWYKVKYNGYCGWVNKKDLNVI